VAHDPGFDDYVGQQTVEVFEAASGKAVACYGLWGDGVRRIGAPQGGRQQVRIRGQTGWIETAALGGSSLLEFYFIDVGQGDGVLIKTPDFRHIMLDGGYPRRSQPTGKSAADFVDWKFAKDYGHTSVVLDAMISSHIDYDHYGGLDDILDVAQAHELDCQSISVEAFYHSGLSHWAAHAGQSEGLGPWSKTQDGRSWFTRCLDDRSSAQSACGGQGPQLRGYWRAFIEKVLGARRADGAQTPIVRLDQDAGWLPGFGQGSQVPIRVLGPLATSINGHPAVMRLASSKSQNTNGASVLLRVDCGPCRVLLTGDLNANAQRRLLDHYEGREREFASDVAKACHHGSEDISFPFLNHIKAACTVISSGDAEGHDHPRPRVVAASGLSGYATYKGDELLTPLVYSTELARSVQVASTKAVSAGQQRWAEAALQGVQLEYETVEPGGLRPKKGKRSARGSRLMTKLLYGLVNVRTDGRKILAATMNEGDGSFSAKPFESRFL